MEIALLPFNVKAKIKSSSAINTVTRCVTELVLNSLDAKSSAIAIRINLFSLRIQVVDNGEGISKSNFEKIGIRYMTNRCHSVDDLDKKVKYYGYKGETLACLVHTCKSITITSKQENHETYVKNLKEGNFIQAEDRQSAGTTVTIEGLFSNLPVRQKNIKEGLELDEIGNYVQSLSILHPHVSFTVRNDLTGKLVFVYAKQSSAMKRLIEFFPDIKETDMSILKVCKDKLTLESLLCNTMIEDKKSQLLYVNKRPVTVTKLRKFVISEYLKLYKKAGNKMDKNKQPVFVINLKCPVSEVSITYESTKTKAHFKNWNLIFRCVKKVLENFIGKNEVPNEKENIKDDDFKSNCGISQICGAVKATAFKHKLETQPSSKRLGENTPTNSLDVSANFESPPKIQKVESLTQQKKCAMKKKNKGNSKPLPITTVQDVIKRRDTLCDGNKIKMNCNIPEENTDNLEMINDTFGLDNNFGLANENFGLANDEFHNGKIDERKNCFRKSFDPSKIQKVQSLTQQKKSSIRKQLPITTVQDVSKKMDTLCDVNKTKKNCNIPEANIDNLELVNDNFGWYNNNFGLANENFGLAIENFGLAYDKFRDGKIDETKKYFPKSFQPLNKTQQALVAEDKGKELIMYMFLKSTELYHNEFEEMLDNSGDTVLESKVILQKKARTKSHEMNKTTSIYFKLKANKQLQYPKNETFLDNFTFSTVRAKKQRLDKLNEVGSNLRKVMSHRCEEGYFRTGDKKDEFYDLDKNTTNKCVQTSAFFNTFNKKDVAEYYPSDPVDKLFITPESFTLQIIDTTWNDIVQNRIPRYNLQFSKINECFTRKRSKPDKNLVENNFFYKPKPTRDFDKDYFFNFKKLFLNGNSSVNFITKNEKSVLGFNRQTENINLENLSLSPIPKVKTNFLKKVRNTKKITWENVNKNTRPGRVEKMLKRHITESPRIKNKFNNSSFDTLVKLHRTKNNIDKLFSLYKNKNSVRRTVSCQNNGSFTKDSLNVTHTQEQIYEKPQPLWENFILNKKNAQIYKTNEAELSRSEKAILKSKDIMDDIDESNFTFKNCILDIKNAKDDRDHDLNLTDMQKFRKKINHTKSNEDKIQIAEESCVICDDSELAFKNFVPKAISTQIVENCSLFDYTMPSIVLDGSIEILSDEERSDFQAQKNEENEMNKVVGNCDDANIDKVFRKMPCSDEQQSNIFISLNEQKRNHMIEKNLASEKLINKQLILEFLPSSNENETVVSLNDEWIKKLDQKGDAYFLNTRTGMTSRQCPRKFNLGFEFKTRPSFIPKGLSPVLVDTYEINTPLNSQERENLQDAILDNYESDINLIKWERLLENKDPKKFFENICKEKLKLVPSEIVSARQKPYTYDRKSITKFTKNIYSNLEIVGQLDLKFIVVFEKKEKSIILFDQHAVHERIRLEKLTRDYVGKNNACNQNVTLFMPQSDINLLNKQQDALIELGLDFLVFKNGITVNKIPLSLYNKVEKEKGLNIFKLPQYVENLIKEILETMKKTRGVLTSSPKFLQNIVNMEACRGAIKFGEKLSYSESENLLKDLFISCNLPFQCAHGRPTMIPLINLNSGVNHAIHKPNLKKLKA